MKTFWLKINESLFWVWSITYEIPCICRQNMVKWFQLFTTRKSHKNMFEIPEEILLVAILKQVVLSIVICGIIWSVMNQKSEKVHISWQPYSFYDNILTWCMTSFLSKKTIAPCVIVAWIFHKFWAKSLWTRNVCISILIAEMSSHNWPQYFFNIPIYNDKMNKWNV